MDSESINNLLALLSGNLSPSERERILAQVALDDEARELLLFGSLIPPTSNSITTYSFQVLPGILVGVQQDYFRVIQIDHLRLGKQERIAEKALSTITFRRSPLCFKNRLQFEMEEASSGRVRLTLCWRDGEVILKLGGGGGTKDHLEIWKGGELFRAIAASVPDVIPGKLFDPVEPLVLRFSNQDRGFTLQWLPVEFGLSDWVSACLTAVLAGNLREATLLLRTEILERFPDPGRIEGRVALLDSVGALTKNLKGILAPVPLTRSETATREDRKSALHVVWRGIVSRWPDVALGSNPWNEDTEPFPLKPELPEGVWELIKASFDAVEREPDSSGWPADAGSDRNLAQGWAALRGWTELLSGEPGKAKKSFESVERTLEDPFSLREGVCLADHLIAYSVGFPNREQVFSSSLRVWREIFEKVLE